MSKQDALVLEISHLQDQVAKFAKRNGVTVSTTIVAPTVLKEAETFVSGTEHTSASDKELAAVAAYDALTNGVN